MSIESLAGHPTHLLSLEDAQAVLASYQGRLNRCIQHGWDAWKQDYAHKLHILGARARASIVFDEIVACALQEFPPCDEYVVSRTPTTFMLFIGDSIILRFKKLRKSGKCSSIPTGQQMEFLAQMQLTLPTMQKGTLVHAGYLLDPLGQEILRKSVVCQVGNSVLWEFRLADEGAAIVDVMPPAPASPAPAETSRYEPKPERVPVSPATATREGT